MQSRIMNYLSKVRVRVTFVIAADLFKRLGYHNIETRVGNGYHGWPEHAPYDSIIVTAAATHKAFFLLCEQSHTLLADLSIFLISTLSRSASHSWHRIRLLVGTA